MPVSPGTTASPTAFTAVATTGTPHIMASTMTVGSPSYLLGSAKMSKAGSRSATSARSPGRMSRTAGSAAPPAHRPGQFAVPDPDACETGTPEPPEHLDEVSGAFW